MPQAVRAAHPSSRPRTVQTSRAALLDMRVTTAPRRGRISTSPSKRNCKSACRMVARLTWSCSARTASISRSPGGSLPLMMARRRSVNTESDSEGDRTGSKDVSDHTQCELKVYRPADSFAHVLHDIAEILGYHARRNRIEASIDPIWSIVDIVPNKKLVLGYASCLVLPPFRSVKHGNGLRASASGHRDTAETLPGVRPVVAPRPGARTDRPTSTTRSTLRAAELG